MNGTKNNIIKTATAAAIFLLLAVAIIHGLWRAGAFLPRRIRWETASFSDQTGDYQIELRHRRVTVTWQGSAAGQEHVAADAPGEDDRLPEEGSIVWTSPSGMKVQKALSADIDNDGRD